MAKTIIGYIKLEIPAGKANPSPPIGPALGQRGLNIPMFCKEFNASTQDMEAGTPVPVVITAYSDKSFTFIKKLPPVSYYVKKVSKIVKGSSLTKREAAVATITKQQCQEIANVKMVDMNTDSSASALKTVIGTARSIGLEVVD